MRFWITFFDVADALLGGVIVTQPTEFDAYDYAQTNSFYPGGTVTAIADPASDDYPLADDTFRNAAAVTALRASNGSPRLAVTVTAAELLDRLVAADPAGVDYDFGGGGGPLPLALLTDPGAGHGMLTGRALQLDGPPSFSVTIGETGIYSVSSVVVVETGGSTLASALIELGVYAPGAAGYTPVSESRIYDPEVAGAVLRTTLNYTDLFVAGSNISFTTDASGTHVSSPDVNATVELLVVQRLS